MPVDPGSLDRGCRHCLRQTFAIGGVAELPVQRGLRGATITAFVAFGVVWSGENRRRGVDQCGEMAVVNATWDRFGVGDEPGVSRCDIALGSQYGGYGIIHMNEVQPRLGAAGERGLLAERCGPREQTARPVNTSQAEHSRWRRVGVGPIAEHGFGFEADVPTLFRGVGRSLGRDPFPG